MTQLEKMLLMQSIQQNPGYKAASMVDPTLRFLGGKDFALDTQAKLMARGGEATKLGRMAGSKAARKALRFVPGLGVGLAALDAADVITGNESLGNKAMDAAGMTIGGTLGAIGGPLGIATGVSLGKMGSDALQYLFGDKLTPEQRKMREALMMLQGGRY
ncbi:MAG: hypothetical protein CMM87_01065 [Rickettsiales bacterium]|nr:hypothetical protein [Rickettsiales bacterium]|tara:strand:+ start:684 stop:1163 length:480 start_codon:yes stop_codon:yes gene_type:complete